VYLRYAFSWNVGIPVHFVVADLWTPSNGIDRTLRLQKSFVRRRLVAVKLKYVEVKVLFSIQKIIPPRK